MLKEEGITNWLAKRRPLLTPEVVKKRLQFCKKYEHWSYEEWSKIIFSDECSLDRGVGARRTWVFRTPHEKWNQEMIMPYKKGKDISVIIWGTIYGDGRSDVVIMDRDPDSEKSGYSANSYLAVLRDQISRVYQPGITFMQDGASIHTAKKVKKWFEEEDVVVLNWPPYSPDLNPIKHLWAQLKQWINEHYPDLVNMGKSEEAYQRLFKAIREGWKAIGQEAINNLIKSMDIRINSVLNAQGSYTRF
jgi:DDE superfamily endonuclease